MLSHSPMATHSDITLQIDIALAFDIILARAALHPFLYLALRARLWAGPGQLRPPLNINALRVNLVNIDIVDGLYKSPDATWRFVE